MTLTGRTGLVAVAGGLVIAVFGTGVASLIVNAAILAALAADLLFAASIGGLQVSRSGETKIGLGQTGTTTLTLINAGNRRLRGVVRDGWRPSAVAQPGRSRIDLPAGRRVTVTTTLTPSRRGDVAAGLVTIRSFGPLGLAGRQRSLAAPFTVRVLPAFLSRKHLPAKLARLRELDGHHRPMIPGQGSEVDSLRAYVLVADVRSIDWRSTARRADIVVRTWRPERDRRVGIVLDTGRTSAGRVGVDPTAGDPGGWPRLDWSMDAALLLAALAARAGDHVDFIAHDRVTRAGVYNASRSELLARLVDAMAPLQPALVESDARAMVAAVRRRIRQRALVVLLTDLNASALDEGLMAVLPH